MSFASNNDTAEACGRLADRLADKFLRGSARHDYRELVLSPREIAALAARGQLRRLTAAEVAARQGPPGGGRRSGRPWGWMMDYARGLVRDGQDRLPIEELAAPHRLSATSLAMALTVARKERAGRTRYGRGSPVTAGVRARVLRALRRLPRPTYVEVGLALGLSHTAVGVIAREAGLGTRQGAREHLKSAA